MKKEILLFSTDQITAMRDTGNIFRKVLLKRTQKYTLLVYVEENEKKKKKRRMGQGIIIVFKYTGH